MSRNYKISAHPYYHAARCAKRTAGTVIRNVWCYFVYPFILISCGVAVGCQLARMFGSALGAMWR